MLNSAVAEEPLAPGPPVDLRSLAPGQVGGLVVDATGAAIPRALLTVVNKGNGTVLNTYTDEFGRWVVSAVPSGNLRITASALGFASSTIEPGYDNRRPAQYSLTLRVGSTNESVEVTSSPRQMKRPDKSSEAADSAGSLNVQNLQRRVAGVLPIAMDVPRAGNSFRFVRPLVIEEETKVTFNYKSK